MECSNVDDTLASWAAGLRYTQDAAGKEMLVDSWGFEVVSAADRGRLEGSVDTLRVDRSCDVLEVGFGCGFSAERIHQGRPRSHTIIECSEIVLKRLRKW